MNTPHTKLTYEDFLNFPDDGRLHELIDGEHYVSPSPNLRHQELVVRLVIALGQYLKGHPIGRVFCARLDCVITNVDVVEPDVLVVLSDQFEILTEKNIQGTPALVIEILSPGTSRRDRGIKGDLYSREGVREYWIVDPVGNVVEVSRTGDHGLQLVGRPSASRDETLTTPLLPDFALPLAEFFKPSI